MHLLLVTDSACPNCVLFDVDIYNMRLSVLSLGSAELRIPGVEPKLRFRLSGRSDLVVLQPGRENVSRLNLRYAIVVKVNLGFNVNESLREAYLQLVGLNADNNNSSPPVLLSDLNDIHFVLYLELKDSSNSHYFLRIEKSTCLISSIRRCCANS